MRWIYRQLNSSTRVYTPYTYNKICNYCIGTRNKVIRYRYTLDIRLVNCHTFAEDQIFVNYFIVKLLVLLKFIVKYIHSLWMRSANYYDIG